MESKSGETGQVHIESDEARAGSTPHVVRWILGISLLAAVVLMSAIWIFGAASHDPASDPATVTTETTAEQAAQQGDDGEVLMDGSNELNETVPPADAVDTPLQTIPNDNN